MGGGVNSGIQQQQLQQTQVAEELATEANTRAQSLYNLTAPGLAQSEQYYQALASGDPQQIQAAIAPASQQIQQQTQNQVKNIMQNAPSGGEKNLAIEQAQTQEGAQIGGLATSAYTGAQNALGQLAGQGIGESSQQSGLALSGTGLAAQGLGTIQQQNVQAKGQQLGLLGNIATGAGTAIGGKA